MNKEIEEVLDYYQKEIDKYEETKQYLIEKYGYDEETIDNISQHQKYKNNKLLLSYIEQIENLCNKYEQEHKTTFEIWKKDIKKLEQLENNRDKAIEFLKTEHMTYDSAWQWRQALINILKR